MTNSEGTRKTLRLTWRDVQRAVDEVCKQASEFKWDTIIAVSRGGLVPGRLVAAKLGVTNLVVWDRNHGVLGKVTGHALIVDDIADSGATARAAVYMFGAPIAVLVSKVPVEKDIVNYVGLQLTPEETGWVVFPFEGKADKLNTRQSIERETVKY
jgi:xanthine phosphoribosyltransferase